MYVWKDARSTDFICGSTKRPRDLRYSRYTQRDKSLRILEAFTAPRHFLFPPFRAALATLLTACASQSFPQAHNQSKVFGGYFEEWGIGYAPYNIADLQKNAAADELTHLIYAFGNVTATASPTCAIADPSAAYQDSTLPSVSGKPYTAPLYGNFGAIQQFEELHPNLKVLISLGR